MEVTKILTEYYGSYDEDNRLRSRHGSVEYLTTMRYVEKYLQPGMRVLEIGAATGRYSHSLARQGYRVDAVELVQHNIDIFKANTQSSEDVRIYQGNAKNLDMLSNDTYDITLLLGPMYHLFAVPEQLEALSEAIRVTKKGGDVFAAYCGNEATMIQYCFGRGMIKAKGTAAKIFNALADANINIKMIDQGSSELNIIVGVEGKHYAACIQAIYNEFFNENT